MSPHFSLIVSTRNAQDSRLHWHRALTGPAVQVIVIENNARCGLGQAYNEGLDQATGVYCGFIHDDVEVTTPGWLEQLAAAVTTGGYDLVGLAGSQVLPSNGVWWAAPTGALRGEVWHREANGALTHNRYGMPDDAAAGLSPVVSLDGMLLFGRREHFLVEPFDTEFFDGFHYYDADLCLRWVMRHRRRLGVVHGLHVIHGSGGALEGIEPFQERFFFRFGGFLPLDLAGAACWRRNLEALRLFDPCAAALLTAGRPPGKTQLFEEHTNGDLFALRPDGSVSLADGGKILPEGADLVLLGAGDGRLLKHAWARPECRVLLIEPEAHLLLRLLSRQDWATPLGEGRLHLRLPVLDHSALGEIALQELIAELQQRALNDVPLVWAEGGSARLHPDFFQALKAAPERLAGLTRRLLPIAETTNAFDLRVISPSCVIFDDLAECFTRLGLRVDLYRVPDRVGVWTEQERRNALDTLRSRPARITLLRNRSMLETENPRRRIPWEAFLPGRLASWWWDVPNVASIIDLDATPTPWPAFAFARALLPLLPAGSVWLPPGARSLCGADPAPDEGQASEPVIAFVGQSRYALLVANLQTLAQAIGLLCGRSGLLLANDINRTSGILAIYRYLRRQEPEVRRIIHRLRRGAPTIAYYLEYLLDMSFTGAFRIAGIALLTAQGLPLVVYGDEEWLRTGAIAPQAFRGVIEPQALPALYRRSRVNLNLNFMQVSSTVNPKVLDICAAGGTVLTDDRPEIPWLYPDPACRPFCFRNLEELPEQAAALLGRDFTAHQAALQAHTRAHHMLEQRARWIAEQLQLI